MTIAQVYYSDSGQKKCIYFAQITTKMFDRTGFIWRLQSIAAAILLQVSFKMEVTYSSQKIKALNRIIEYTLIDYRTQSNQLRADRMIKGDTFWKCSRTRWKSGELPARYIEVSKPILKVKWFHKRLMTEAVSSTGRQCQLGIWWKVFRTLPFLTEIVKSKCM